MAAKTFVLVHATSFTQEVNCWDDDVDFASGTAYTQSLSDTITLSDAKVLGIGLIKADTITLSDSLSRVWTAFLSLSDTVTLSDAIANAISLVKADIVSMSDAIANAVGKLLSDTISLSDAIANAIGKVVSDTITMTDSAIKSIGKFLSDTFSLSDTISLLSDLLQEIPKVITATLDKAFGITRPEKPSGTTRHTDKTDIV